MVSKQLICIGSSTGGPRALQHLLPQFPDDFPAAILIVQHMPPVFTHLLAKRLDALSNLHVKEAEHNEPVKNGIAYIAPGGRHMTVNRVSSSRLTLQLDDSTPIKSHRPSIDRLFYSLSQVDDYRLTTAILTGMGSDGTNGLKHLKQNEALEFYSIAESEKSCIVYGMPKSAVNANVIDEIVELEKMFETISKNVQ